MTADTSRSVLAAGLLAWDADDDGMSNHREWTGSTNWLHADTDGDDLDRFRATIGEMPYYRPLTAGNETG